MNAKQKEQLGFIEADIFGFGDIMLWNSEMDDRQFIEDKNDYEDFKPYITKVFNDYVEKMYGLSL